MNDDISEDPEPREQAFKDEWKSLEKAANKATGEAEWEVRVHRWTKYGLGIGAIVFGAAASASVVWGWPPAATAGAALVATIASTAQQFQNPFAKEVDHLDRAARYRHIARQIRYLGRLEHGSVFEDRVERIKALSHELGGRARTPTTKVTGAALGGPAAIVRGMGY